MGTIDTIIFFGWVNTDCKKILTNLLGEKHDELILDLFEKVDKDKRDSDDINKMINNNVSKVNKLLEKKRYN